MGNMPGHVRARAVACPPSPHIGILAIVLLTRESSDIDEKRPFAAGEEEDSTVSLNRRLVCGAKAMIVLAGAVLICTVTMTILCETSYGTEFHKNC